MTIVLKIGGAKAVDPAGALDDIVHLSSQGNSLIIVHGGSTAIDENLERMGLSPNYVETPSGVVGRFTDEATMKVFTMTMAGLLNTNLVVKLQNLNINAVGLSGVDGRLLHGPRKDSIRTIKNGKKKILRGDHSGKITSVNTDLIQLLLDNGYVPVISPPMLSDDGIAVNTDADRVSSSLAGSLSATLVSLTDVSGIYRDISDPTTLISSAKTPEQYSLLQNAAEGFMTRKLMAATDALQQGAEKAIIASANEEQPLLSALDGGGTHIYPEAIL
ncbi:MAG TPA: acetylglutamate/acetylaminoadipate kinase [Halobacteriales archaeon]|uniref:acetylglutamate/acetylaminoadipate kinase n=1 Tax=Candidatus Hikarchaeum yamanae TaxID=2675326 RepID=UPI0017D6C16B|nr:acetylglutamate/acetylaminoadipate kinase [Halobacteriales archaeon]|tara:strand:+ start:9402 stop:10223 length:822 start_codon:yes stop_codon:yes gene_type:complete